MKKNSPKIEIKKNEDIDKDKKSKSQAKKKERKRPYITIPIFQINKLYNEMKIEKKQPKKKKKKKKNKKRFNFFPQNQNNFMFGNVINTMPNMSSNQNINNNILKELLKEEKNYFYEKKDEGYKELNDLNAKYNDNDDKKSITNKTDFSYKDIPVDLDFLSTATSLNEDDNQNDDDTKNKESININLQKNIFAHNIEQKNIYDNSNSNIRHPQQLNDNNFNRDNIFNQKRINNCKKNASNIIYFNYFQYINYLNMISQMNNMKLLRNNYPINNFQNSKQLNNINENLIHNMNCLDPLIVKLNSMNNSNINNNIAKQNNNSINNMSNKYKLTNINKTDSRNFMDNSMNSIDNLNIISQKFSKINDVKGNNQIIKNNGQK
jgi:hypothetical protein